MANGFNDEVFETLLKAAVIQNSLNELDTYPSEEDFLKITISDTCDHKIRRMIKMYWLKKRLIKGLIIAQKMASIIAIVFGISFIILLQFKDVRAACYTIIYRLTDKYIQVDYSSTKKKATIEVNYIPDGYYEIAENDSENGYSLKYQNGEGDKFTIYYFMENSTNLDNEHYAITDISVNGKYGKYFSSTDNHFKNMLMWYTDNGYFLITSSLNKDELMKIAKNIK